MKDTMIAAASLAALLLTTAGALADQAPTTAPLPASANAVATDASDTGDLRNGRTLEAIPMLRTSKPTTFRYLTPEQENAAYQAELAERYHIEHSP